MRIDILISIYLYFDILIHPSYTLLISSWITILINFPNWKELSNLKVQFLIIQWGRKGKGYLVSS